MSSFVRTFAKRIMKKRGYVRQTSRVVVTARGPQVVPYKRGEGPILNNDGDPATLIDSRNPDKPGKIASTHWPRFIPALETEKKSVPRKARAARGSRRGKSNAAFVASRKANRDAALTEQPQ